MLRFILMLTIAFLALPVLAAEEPTPECIEMADAIRTGMTRAEVERLMQPDGGISGIFKHERFFFTGLRPGQTPGPEYWNRKFCMLTLDFHPYGLSNDIYNDANKFMQWIEAKKWHPDPRDTVVRVSPPFTDNYHFN